MKFAQRVFFWSGVYGILALLPLYFLEGRIGRELPPPTNHPEQYYAFIGVALAWQFAFLVIARDPRRYRPLMLPAIAEKFLVGGAALCLFALDRISGAVLAPLAVDLAIGSLFVVSYLRTAEEPPRQSARADRSASPAAP